MNWWNKLTELQKLYASFAIPATLFMVIQFILQLVGFAGGNGADSADSGDAAGEIDVGDAADGFDAGDAADGIDVFDTADGFDAGDAAGGIDAFDAADGFDAGDAADGIDIADGADGTDAADLHTGLQFSGEPSGGAETHESVSDEPGQPDAGDGEGHEKANALRLFSFRSIVAFFAIGGWTGIVAIDRNAPPVLSVVLALIAGWIALFFVAWTIGIFIRMQQSGNIRLENAIGADGEVYLTIPSKGMGKVNVIVQERLCEFNAVTEAGRALKTGEKITVLGVASEGVLLVGPKTSPEGAVVKSNN